MPLMPLSLLDAVLRHCRHDAADVFAAPFLLRFAFADFS